MRSTVSRFRGRQHSTAIALRSMVRRLTVTATNSNGFWQLLGFKGAEADEKDETFADVPDFAGVGFAARPKPGNPVETITADVGADGDHPVIVASRDISIEPELEADETAMFNSKKSVKCTQDGTVELGSSGLGDTDGLVHGSGSDPCTGLPYWMLGVTSGVVRGEK